MNLLEIKRKAIRSISESQMQKPSIKYENKQEDLKDNTKSYLFTNSFIPMPKGNFFAMRKSQSIQLRSSQNPNKSVHEILKLNAIVKGEEEQSLDKTRKIIQKSIIRDSNQHLALTERTSHSRGNQSTYQSSRVPTSQFGGMTNRGEIKFMKYYNFEDYLEKKKSSQNIPQQKQQIFQQQQYQHHNDTQYYPLQSQNFQNQQQMQPYQNRGVIHVQKAYITSIPQVKNAKIKNLTLQQKKAIESAEEYSKYLSQKNTKSLANQIGQDNSVTVRQPSLDQIFEKVYQEQKQEEQQQNILRAQYNNKQKIQRIQTEPVKRIQSSPKQTQVRVLRLKDEPTDNNSQISEENSLEMQSSIQDQHQNIKFHKIQITNEERKPKLYEEEFMKEIKVQVMKGNNEIVIDAELGRVDTPEIINMQIQILNECPNEFISLDFKEIYDLPDNPNIKYIKSFNILTNTENIIEVFECSNIYSHLYYFKNLVLRQLLQEKSITPLPTIPTFALLNNKNSNKIVIITVFPVLIPVESIIHFRYFAKKPFPEKQILTMMKSMIFQVKYMYESYRLSVGQINTENIFLDCSDQQLKFFNLSSASIHILPTHMSQFWNSSSLMKDCQELGQCFFMLKNLMTQQRMNERSDSFQIENIHELEEHRDQFSSEIILELLKIKKISTEAENYRQDYDPFKKINKIFESDIKNYQLEIVDLDFKKLEIFLNARILKDNQTLSIYYDKTLQPIKSLTFKKTKTPADEQSELQVCLDNWRNHLQNQEYNNCEIYGDTYIENVDEEEMDELQKQQLAEIYSKQGGVKIILGKHEQGRKYLELGISIHNKLNTRYSSSCAKMLVELAKLDLVYGNNVNCESAASYLLELYFAQLFAKDENISWNHNIYTQIFELLVILASNLNIFEVQPFFYQIIINSMKLQLEQTQTIVKSNQIVDYFMKCVESHQEYSNLKDAIEEIERCIPYAENDLYLEKIALKQSQILSEAREIANTEKVSHEDFIKIEEYRKRLIDCLNPNCPNYIQYIETFEDYFNFITTQSIQTDGEYIEDLLNASKIVGGKEIKQPQKAQKYLLKAMEKIFQSEKYSEEEINQKKLEIYEKIGYYSFEQDQDLLALMWFLLCVLIRLQDLNSFTAYDEIYFRNLNQVSKCCQRLKYNYVYILIQKTIISSLQSEEEQLKVLMNIAKMNIEVANLSDGFEFNQLAKKLAEKLKDYSSLEHLKTYRSSLISKIPDSDEAKEYMISLREKIHKLVEQSQNQEAIFFYSEYFKILEAQKSPQYSIETIEDYNDYADLIWKQGDKKKAMIQFKKGLKVQVKLFSLNDQNTLKNMQNVGVLYYELEMYEQSLILFEDILKTLRRSKTYNIQYFQALEYEANIYKQQKNLDQSLISLHEYHDVIQKFPLKNSLYANKLYEVAFEIGKLYSEQRKFLEAEIYFREALQIKTKLQGNDANIVIQKYLYEYSLCLFQIGNYLEAQSVFKEQVETWKRLRVIKGNQMQIYLDDYHQHFLNYSNLANMFNILAEIKYLFEQKNNKTNIHTNDFYKAICVKLAEIETNYSHKH